MPFVPVAIVGRACVLPGALSPEALWARVLAGDDLTSSAPAGRWGLSPERSLTTDTASAPDRAWSDKGGYVAGFERVWDPTGFAVPAERLAGLDPLFQWVLHTGRAALGEARVADRARVGAVLGNLSFPTHGMARYAEAAWLRDAGIVGGPAPADVDARDRFMSGLPAALLAEALGLGGPALCLDAACASALYAIGLACDRLADGDADVMLAGAVNRADDLFLHVGFCALQALSKTGRSRPFQADADGLLPAEGCVIVALKRLADAERDGDTVHGVIRGVGLANDGRTGGFLAPSSEGQVRAIRAAWHAAGLDPTTVGLVECHATGTPVGDRTELQSLKAVFGAAADVPVGSIKSNLGHPITAAGGAGLLKILGALAAGVRPPTRGVTAPTDALAAPLRLLTAPEPWTPPGGAPRRAALSAFGFGGNDAHLVVEAHTPGVATPAAPAPRAEIAIVALSARLGDGGTDAFARAVRGDAVDGRATHVRVALDGLRTPPRDLQQTLPQQLLVLDALRELADAVGPIPRDRTAVLVGMGTDAEVARWGLRWRLAALAPAVGWDEATLAAAKDGVVPLLEAAGVVGTMPNIPANRVQALLDAAGPGFTVSSEEASGVDALAIAARALRSGQVDLALVGAVDLSCEPVHEAALAAVGRGGRAADGAVGLALVRLDDARRDGRTVLAVLDDAIADRAAPVHAPTVTTHVGRPHAAVGLVDVADAVVALAGSTTPASVRRTVVVDALGGGRRAVTLRGADRKTDWAAPTRSGRVLELPAHLAPVRLPAAKATRNGAPGRAEGGGKDVITVMPPAPWIPPVLGDAPARTAPSPTLAPPAPVAARPAPAPVAVAAPAPGPVAVPAPTATLVPPTGPRAHVLAALAAETQRIATAHAAFLARQGEVHARFLEARRAAAELLLARGAGRAESVPEGGLGGLARAESVPEGGLGGLARAESVPAGGLGGLARAESAPEGGLGGLARAESAPAGGLGGLTRAKSAPAGGLGGLARAAPARRPVPPASQLPGPKLDREGLKVHSSGRISEIFGPAFARQDGFERQVRMPEPPLLLADRLVGIDAEPGKLGKGVLWTETDVGSQAWYLHQDRMPAGVMIEAGQADLMLISWMGIDWLNQSDRIYRLLGCTLTYKDALPRKGDTLRYEIHVDGHAKHGDVRLMFFHYDCVDQHGGTRLEVRGGQAGFFTDAELDDSAGILWSPETGEHDAAARLDPPAVVCERTTFDRAAIEAFAAGDARACFGRGFEIAATHTDTPRIQPPPMLFFTEVSDLDRQGGPWGRGYLKASWRVSPDDWFFEGHFKNDPCMPGTLMFEGCLQALAFYLASLGYTLPRDGWRFEPVPDNAIDMRCRGQVRPTAKELTYEIFVEEVHDGPYPTIYADLLCTVDGLKAFHARRCGLRLVPAWPLEHLADQWVGQGADPEPVAVVDGHAFGWRSMLACAWGRPTEAFGPMYARFDSPQKVPRLPGPPYHFLSRATKIDGPMGGMQVGTSVEVAYDVPPDAWYFRTGFAEKMPFCVLLEAALQPCGWLASFVGCALQDPGELFFRNLDGTGTVHRDVLPDDGTLRTAVKLTKLSKSAGMILVGFEVRCWLDDGADGLPVYDMTTVFGFFPGAALAGQKGLGADAALLASLAEPSDVDVDLKARPARYFGQALRLPDDPLLVIDRITGHWPTGGSKGLGRVRAARRVDASDWYFKAHFFQDPVQPGSLGVEAMVQALQWWAIEHGLGDGLANPTFEPLATGRSVTWKYRGQVRPWNEAVTVDLSITEQGTDDRGRYVVADADLWVDGLRIYSATGLALRVVEAPPPKDRVETLDPAKDAWIGDHRPTWTAPALPLMSIVDRLAGAVPGATAVEDVAIAGWVVVDRPLRLRTAVEPDPSDPSDPSNRGAFRAKLEASTDGATWRVAATGRVRTDAPGEAPEAWVALDGEPDLDPYASGALFHGPAFQVVRGLVTGSQGASAVLDAGACAVPWGTLGQGLLDAGTHPIPHDALHRWDAAIDADVAAYPLKVERLRLFRPLPRSGTLRVEARYRGRLDARRPVTEVQWIDAHGVVAELRLVEILVPKGPLGTLPPADRTAFLRDRAFVPGAALSTSDGDATVLRAADVAASDWLPGTVAAVYGTVTPDVVAEVAVRDHAAARLAVHPSALVVDARGVTTRTLPLNRLVPQLERTKDGARVRGEPFLDPARIEAWWSDWFGLGRWPVEDVYYSLIERFVRRVVLADPAALDAVRGKPVLYLANHQTAIESLLFSVVASGLLELPTVTIAKAEHRGTWLGHLIEHCFAYPGARDPRVITYFDRDDKQDLGRILGELGQEMAAGKRSVMVHVEGTRALSCGEPVIKMSGALLDMALAVGAHVVPVRFTGGLPIEPLVERTEFPVGLGRQDVHLGRPISPAELGALPYKPRKELVIAAINELAPVADERPLPGDAALEADVAARIAARGVTPEHAVVAETLRRSPRRGCAETIELLAAIERGAPIGGAGPRADWLRELARRLAG